MEIHDRSATVGNEERGAPLINVGGTGLVGTRCEF